MHRTHGMHRNWYMYRTHGGYVPYPRWVYTLPTFLNFKKMNKFDEIIEKAVKLENDLYVKVHGERFFKIKRRCRKRIHLTCRKDSQCTYSIRYYIEHEMVILKELKLTHSCSVQSLSKRSKNDTILYVTSRNFWKDYPTSQDYFAHSSHDNAGPRNALSSPVLYSSNVIDCAVCHRFFTSPTAQYVIVHKSEDGSSDAVRGYTSCQAVALLHPQFLTFLPSQDGARRTVVLLSETAIRTRGYPAALTEVAATYQVTLTGPSPRLQLSAAAASGPLVYRSMESQCREETLIEKLNALFVLFRGEWPPSCGLSPTTFHCFSNFFSVRLISWSRSRVLIWFAST